MTANVDNAKLVTQVRGASKLHERWL
jgi:hypothetical protein